MFGNKKKDEVKKEPKEKVAKIELKKHEQEMADAKRRHAQEIEDLKLDHKLELKQRDFDLSHFKDEQVKKLQDQITELKQQKAVLEEKVKMLDKIVDLNADIVDVKKLVNTLIEKIPTIDLKSLTINQAERK